MIVLFLCLISSYLIGSIMSALVIAKLFKLPDPRTLGSGNPGASNMSRVHSKNLGSLTLVGDVSKGFMPLYISSRIIADPTQVCLIALSTFFGLL
nr:glycerol-3-phosphate acyltransferase [Gammaproteobacteria bacterium]